MFVRYVLLLLTMIIVGVPTWAQTTFSGIVNSATTVTSISTNGCQTTISVGDASGLTVGDRILIIQMQDITPGGPSGLFDFATIASVSATTLTLRERLAHTYDLSGTVQVVRVATATDAIVTGTISPLPFNGQIGGVVVFEISGTLELRADIQATGMGFRGGIVVQGSAPCSIMTLVGPNGSADLARRGEGIVFNPPATGSGRSANVNGGGGGAAHNSGGGGGAGAGPGGVGGKQWVGCGTAVDNGGLGGTALTIDPSNTRLYMGGGGGSGQMNNNEGTSGGTGGGIIIIRAQRLIGNGNSVAANGRDVLQDAGRDGAGGGGGGGMILLDVQQITNGLALEAHGGAGGHTTTSAQHGTGGGGGGGAILTSLASVPNDVSTYVWGGTHGENLSFPTDPNRSWGSLDGGDGLMRTSAVFAFGAAVEPPEVTASADVTVCNDTTLVLDATVTKGLSPYRWQWFNEAGSVVGSTRVINVIARPPARFIVRVTDNGGCTDEDTVWVQRGPSPRLTADTLDLGVLSRCAFPFDTSIVIRNLSMRPAAITSIVSPSSVVQILGPAIPTVIGADTSLTLSIRIHGGSSGSATIEIAASDSCDTTVTTLVTWAIDSTSSVITPDVIDLGTTITCDTTTLTDITFTYTGGNAVLDTVLIAGTIPMSITTPIMLKNGDTITPVRSWPGYGVFSARIGFVVTSAGCTDTLWADVTETRIAPTFTIAPIDLGEIVACSDSVTSVSRRLVTNDTASTYTIVDLTMSDSLSTTLSVGMPLSPNMPFLVSLTSPTVGQYTGSLRIRLAPCDSIITVPVTANVVDVAADITPVLTYTQQVIGNTETLRAVFRNTGTSAVRVASITPPQAPYRIISTERPLPATIGVGETMWIDVDVTATPGVFTDSMIVEIDSPCVGKHVTILTSDVALITRLRMTRVVVTDSSWIVPMPIMFDERPNVSSDPPPEFEVRILVDARNAAWVGDASPYGSAQFDTSLVGDDLLITIRDVWRGGDTLALPLLLSLLTVDDSTAVRFDPSAPFRWISTPSVVEYTNGSLIHQDVCASRVLRSIAFGGMMQRIDVTPFPADDVINVTVQTSMPELIALQLSDVHGRPVLTGSTNSQHTYSFNAGLLAAGWYQLIVTTRFETRTVPVIIAR